MKGLWRYHAFYWPHMVPQQTGLIITNILYSFSIPIYAININIYLNASLFIPGVKGPATFSFRTLTPGIKYFFGELFYRV